MMDQLSFYKNSHKRSTNGMSSYKITSSASAASAAIQTRDVLHMEASFANGTILNGEVSMVGAASLGTAAPVASAMAGAGAGADLKKVFKRAARHAACVGHILCSSVGGIDGSVRRAKQLAEPKRARKPSAPITKHGMELFLKTAGKDVRREIFIAMFGVNGIDYDDYDINGFKPCAGAYRHNRPLERHMKAGYNPYSSGWVTKETVLHQCGWAVWVHRNGTRYGDDGYTHYGFRKDKKHRNGTYRDENGRDCMGFDPRGFDINGTHYETFTGYNPEGYDVKGYDRRGYDKDGFNQTGLNERGMTREQVAAAAAEDASA